MPNISATTVFALCTTATECFCFKQWLRFQCIAFDSSSTACCKAPVAVATIVFFCLSCSVRHTTFTRLCSWDVPCWFSCILNSIASQFGSTYTCCRAPACHELTLALVHQNQPASVGSSIVLRSCQNGLHIGTSAPCRVLACCWKMHALLQGLNS